MLDKPESRLELARGIVAGGMILVGLATGSSPLMILLIGTSVSIGSGLLGNIADRAFQNWRDRWFTPRGLLNEPIRQAIMQSFDSTIRQLELDWKNSTGYHHLIYKKEHERARLSLTVMRELREKANALFQDESFFSELQKDKGANLFRLPLLTEDTSRLFFDEAILDYLGVVEPLGEFAKNRFADEWVIRFGEYIKSDKGTAAWRACQELWQASLLASLGQIETSSVHTNETVIRVQEEVTQLRTWLEQWSSQTQNQTRSDSFIMVAYDRYLETRFDALNDTLRRVETNTHLILNLLNERFSELDFEQVMTIFLQKELLNDQFVKLEQAGHNAENDDISLAKVFVDLPAANDLKSEPPEEKSKAGSLPSGIIAEILESANEHLDPESLRMHAGLDQEKRPEKGERKAGRFVIIGGPGQGKTTTSQFICQLFRTVLLKNRDNNSYYSKVHQALAEIDRVCVDEGISLPTIPRIPFRIILSDFAAKLADERTSDITSLLSYIVHRIQTRTNKEITHDHLRKWLGSYPWLILLDGLDEVPASSNRDAVLSAIDDFWIDATAASADVLVVATTRPQGYNKDFAPALYRHRYLTPLSNARALHYANRLVKIRYHQEQDRQKKILERLETALEDEATSRIMRTPLQVTIMAALVDRIGKPPQERWTLFQKYYDVIYSRETERDIPAATILRNFAADISAIHYQVGLLLQTESEYSGQTRARLPMDRFEKIVEIRLEDEGHEGKEKETLKKQIIDAAAERLVFLVGVEAGEIGFEIRSFQEFMAAEGVMQGSDDVVRQRLREIAPIIHWRNVFLFAAGKCFAHQDKQYLREDIRGICVELNEKESATDQIAHLTLAGSQLALDLLEDGTAQRQPKYAKTLARLALSLLDLPIADYHFKLANSYDPKLEDVFREEVVKRLQGKIEAQLGTWACLMSLLEKQVEWALNLFTASWSKEKENHETIFDAMHSVGKGEQFISLLGDSVLAFSRPDDLLIGYPSPNFDPKKAPIASIMKNTLRRPSERKFVALRLPDGLVLEHQFSFDPINQRRATPTNKLELGEARDEWHLLFEAERFAQNPSESSLASALESISHLTIDREKLWYGHWIPWPLRVILGECLGNEDLGKLANQAKIGEFGDLAKWKAAEERWTDTGITIEDLDYTLSSSLPYDENIDKIGFAFLDLAFDRKLDDTSERVNQLTQFFKRSQGKRYRGLVADWILHETLFAELDRHPRAVTSRMHFSFNDFKQITNAAPRDIPITGFFDKVEWGEADPQEYAEFLNDIGNREYIRVYPFYSSDLNFITTFLSETFVEYPFQQGILNLLAELAKGRETPKLPEHLLELKRYSNLRLQQSVILLRLLSKNISQDEAKNLANVLCAIGEGDMEGISSALEAIQNHRLINPATDAFLIELDHLVQSGKWSTKSKIIKLLNDSLAYRKSDLREKWNELGFSQNIKELIRVETDSD